MTKKLTFEEFKEKYVTSKLTREAVRDFSSIHALDLAAEIDALAIREYELYLERLDAGCNE